MGTTADEWASAGELTGEGLTVLTGMLADTHDAVLQRVQRALPPRGAAIAARHRRTVGKVYRAVRSSHRAVPAVTGAAAAVMGGDAPSVASSKVGTAVLPIVNGLWGDQLAARSEPLAIQMAVRRRNADIAPDAASLDEAFPDAKADIVVFLHGLFETERCWARGRRTAIRSGCSATSTSRQSAHPVQHRPAGQRQRPAIVAVVGPSGRRVARARACGRAGGPFDGRVGRPQRLPHRPFAGRAVGAAGAPPGQPRYPAPGLPGREGRASGRPGPAQAAGDGAPGHGGGASAAWGSRTCGSARSPRRTGRGTTRTSSCGTAAPMCRCWTTPRTTGSPRR